MTREELVNDWDYRMGGARSEYIRANRYDYHEDNICQISDAFEVGAEWGANYPTDETILKITRLHEEFANTVCQENDSDDEIIKEYYERCRELKSGQSIYFYNEYLLKYIKAHWND